MSTLTLPGGIPGLLRRGSPVVDPHDPACTGVVEPCGPKPDEWHVLWGRPNGRKQRVEDFVFGGRLALDLTDATGRAHAAWWLEGRDPRWRMLMAGRRGGELLRLLECAEPHARLGADEREARGRVRLALAGLSPNDTRPLPDGSRWVDAEALRLVCLHVAGRAP